MNYPLISEYIEAIKAAEDNFAELKDLRPVLGEDGLPVMTSGNFAVVFKMKDEQTGKLYATKCFIKDQERRAESYRLITEELKNVSSPYIIGLQYLDKELFVDSTQTDETEFPILLMDWVEGKTLDKYLRENLDDKYALEMLVYRFSQLAQWLIPQPFAHGDLKPDNILVREDGSLVLVDYDGMYVPAMKGQKARELGSPDYRHPLRTEDDFDEHIDDFPIVSILLSLKLVAYKPNMIEVYGSPDRLLLSKNDYIDFSQCSVIKTAFPSKDQIINNLISVFSICLVDQKLNLALLPYLQHDILKYLSTRVPTNDENKYIDNFGTEYGSDRKRLYKVGRCREQHSEPGLSPFHSEWVNILDFDLRQDIRIICDNAFKDAFSNIDGYYYSLDNYNIDNSLMAIGDYAFMGVSFRNPFEISENLMYLGKNPFALTDVSFSGCSSPNFVLDDMALFTKDHKMLIQVYNDFYWWYRVPDGVETIGEYSFSRMINDYNCNHYISLPDSIESIGDYAFMNCNLYEIRLPRNIRSIGKDIFYGCKNLREIIVPSDSFELYWGLLPNYRDLLKEEIDTISVQVPFEDYILFEEERLTKEGDVHKQIRQNHQASAILKFILFKQRKTIAEKMRISPYAILSDESIEQMALTYPMTLEELKNIKGIGEYKLKKPYMTEFVEIIQGYCIANKINIY